MMANHDDDEISDMKNEVENLTKRKFNQKTKMTLYIVSQIQAACMGR